MQEEEQRYVDFARDSVSFFRNGAGRILTVTDKETDYSTKKSETTSNFNRYIFRKDGQISSSIAYNSDSSFSDKSEYVYLHTGQVSRIVKSFGGTAASPAKTDTIRLTYDRTGKLFSYCEKGECIDRLYNSKQQLIVKRNALYGYKRGDFVYAYDKDGYLVQRKFLEPKSGIVLCTDTIEYIHSGEEMLFVTEKHFIRISGNAEWIPIDEMQYDGLNSEVTRYAISHYNIRGMKGVHAPGYVEYSYNSDGKIAMRKWNDRTGITEKKFNYYASCDTIRTYKIVQEKKTERRILESETVINYNPEGLIVSVTDTDYEIVKQRRKWKVAVSMIREQKYDWK